MTIPFRDAMKAQITQAVTASLLERGGYRVVRLGIEELFREVKGKQLDQYRALRLPAPLRYLPDLLVASLEANQAFLVEIKFRCRFDEDSAQALHEKLARQRRYWPHSYAVLMISEPFVANARFHQDFIRVLPPDATRRLIDERLDPRQRWQSLPHLQKVFHNFSASAANRALADFVTLALKGLAGLCVQPQGARRGHPGRS
jgi:hypothetical protein